MMHDATVSDSVQVRLFYLYENERYSPILGWSSKALMPTDRHAFTTSDGREGFPSVSEATIALSCVGKYCSFCGVF
jgi:hypothetical protein